MTRKSTIPRITIQEPPEAGRQEGRVEVTATGTGLSQPIITLSREYTDRGKTRTEMVYLYPEMIDQLMEFINTQRANWPPREEA